MAERAPRPAQSLTARIASVVLTLEIPLLFFAALVAFGLRALPPAAAFLGAFGIAVLLGAGILLLRRPGTAAFGVRFGWVMQAVLVLTGLVLPLMYVIGVIFAALYGYGVIRAQHLEAHPPESPTGEAAP